MASPSPDGCPRCGRVECRRLSTIARHWNCSDGGCSVCRAVMNCEMYPAVDWQAFARDALARAEAAEKRAEAAEGAITPDARLLLDERARQVVVEGWTPEHDDEHTQGELAMAAASYAIHGNRGDGHPWRPPSMWPWASEWWKPTPDDRMRELVKAGALILAEIARLQRAVLPAPTGDGK